jgi:hypothetical protein
MVRSTLGPEGARSAPRAAHHAALRAACAATALATVLAALACGEDPPPAPPPPPTKLAFVVRDALTDAPLAQAAVLVGPTRKRLVTDATGRVELETSAATTVVVEASGYVSRPTPYEAELLATPVAEQTTDVRVALEPRPNWSGGGSIAGRVTVGGAPKAGVLVFASASQDFTTLTDADGVFNFLGVPQGLYTLNTFAAGHVGAPKTGVDVLRGEAEQGVELTMSVAAGAVVQGRLTGLTGLTGTTAVGLELAATGDLVPGLEVASVAGGRFTLPGVPPGRYLVRATRASDGLAPDPDVKRTGMAPSVEVTTATAASVTVNLVPAVLGLVPSSTTTDTQPILSWRAHPGADFYIVELRGADGRLVWGGFDARRNPQFRIPTTTIRFGDTVPPLEQLAAGRSYRWQIYAAKDEPQLSSYRMLAASEELDGAITIRRR